MDKKAYGFHQHWIIALGIVLLVGIFYGNTLNNGFIHDDHGQVEQNTFIQSWDYLPKVITGCIWESAVGNCKKTFYYRPLQTLSYLMTYSISHNPWVFHLINLIYFSLVIYLAFILVLLLSKNRSIAILTALIVLIHPINSEVVNWIAAVPELLYTIGVLSATIFFIRFRETKNIRYLVALAVSFLCALAAKEPAAFVLFVFVVLDIFHNQRKNKQITKNHIMMPYIICGVLVCIYMILRFSVLGGLGWDPTMIVSVQQRALIVFDLLSSYVKALFIPYPLNLYYPYVIPTRTLSLPIVSGFALLAASFGLLIVAIKKKWRMIAFSITWFVSFLTPSLIFINSIGENLYAERHVFASTIGFAFILGSLCYAIWKREVLGKWIISILVTVSVIITFSIIIPRNTLWHDDERLYTYTLQISPTADLVRYNLALLYRDKGDLAKAKNELMIIKQRNTWSGLYKTLNNLGDIARRENQTGEAIGYFRESIRQNPQHVPAYNNLGALYFEQGDLLQSIQTFCKGNTIDPSFPQLNSNYDQVIRSIQSMSSASFAQFASQLSTIFHVARTITQQPQLSCMSDGFCDMTIPNPFTQYDVMLSYAAFGVNNSGVIYRPESILYTPQSHTIVFRFDKTIQGQLLRLILPTCGGVYDEIKNP